MNDISKARFFLKAHGSKLETLETFALMLATAESEYKDVRMRQRTNRTEGARRQELPTAVDLGVLRYLKNHGRLPDNVGEIISPETSDARKLELAKQWYGA
jgi:hypothetical protein